MSIPASAHESLTLWVGHSIDVWLILDLEQEDQHSKGDCITQLLVYATQRTVQLLHS